MSSNEVPEPWRTRLVERDFTDPRYADDRPSIRRLGAAIGVHPSTISNAISGRTRASEETVARLVDALGADVADWLGRSRPREWMPPAEAALLTDRQRKAVEEIIKSMTERQEQRHGTPQEGTPNTRAAGSAAPEQSNVVDLPTAAHPMTGAQSAGRRQARDQDEQGES